MRNEALEKLCAKWEREKSPEQKVREDINSRFANSCLASDIDRMADIFLEANPQYR